MRILSTFIISVTAIVFLYNNSCTDKKYIGPGRYIDSDNPIIIKKVKALINKEEIKVKKVKTLFEFVRDSIDERYLDQYKASEVLEKKYGYCYNKAILLAAMCRAAGIPSRLSFDKVNIKDHYDDKTMTSKDIRFLHGITEIYLSDKWIKYDCTGNIKRWKIWTQGDSTNIKLPLEFREDKEVLFHSEGRIKFERTSLFFFDWDQTVEKLVLKFNRY